MRPKLAIVGFHRAMGTIARPLTKFGGQPAWLTEPSWPMSAGWDERPMQFLAQIELDPRIFGALPGRMAYIFLSHQAADERADENWFFDPDMCFPDEGENAVIIQPGGRYAGSTRPLTQGPTLYLDDGTPAEFTVDQEWGSDPDTFDVEAAALLGPVEKAAVMKEAYGYKIGGTPGSIRSLDAWIEDGGRWHLLLQVGSRVPFVFNIGGSGPLLFAFIDQRGARGMLFIEDS